jgi:NADPH:quinone reductase-like Zn-dependent oxidoreductase
VLVTSAPGRIGKELVALLAKSGKFTVRAAAFTPEKADMLRSLGTPLAMPYATESAP